MKILGLGGSDHDVSTALLVNGEIVCAIEEERVTRKKYSFNSNLLLGHSRKYVLNACNTTLKDIELVVVDDILPKTAYYAIRNNVEKVNHHMLHAASAFYPSDFENAAVLVVDNAGSYVEYNNKKGLETITYAYGKGNKIEVLNKVIGEEYHVATDVNGDPYQKGDPNNSLGYFYKLISHYVGFNFIVSDDFYFTEDGKTMGLAPYGNNKYYERLQKFVQLKENGQLEIDLRSGAFEKELECIMEGELSEEESFNRKADLSWAGQCILEEALIHCANYLYEITKCDKLCIAGGVGLNSVANGKILKNTPFNEIFVQPASGDNGTSLGAALYGYYNIKGVERLISDKLRMKTAYLGKCYSDQDIDEVLNSFENIVIEKPQNLPEQAAKLISEGKIVSLFQGGSEFGPRALGNRSILADPTRTDMKDLINSRVKFREGFRPFAPAVLFEYQKEYFDIEQYTPYMLIVADVIECKKEHIPSVTHVDGTARLQSVIREYNELYYDIIDEFRKITGVPVLLNTSFNVKGEPIVETPEDAIKCFSGTDIDHMVIGSYLLSKRK